MAWPDGVPTRRVSAGRGLTIERGASLAVRLTVRSERGTLVWAATGDRLMSSPAVAEGGAGAPASIELPCTDSAGWIDDQGREIDVSEPGSYTHRYVATIEGLDSSRRVVSSQKVTFVVPAGDGDIDLDRGIEAGTVEGEPILVPSDWSLIVTDAREAADRAEAARADAETARDEAEAIAAQPDGIRDNADRAEAERSAAEAARDTAVAAKDAAEEARSGAEQAQDAAAGSESAASASATQAAASASAASGAAATAESAQASAAADRTAAETARTGAQTARTAAETARSAAVAAQGAAETARDAAQAAQQTVADDIDAAFADTGWVAITPASGFVVGGNAAYRVRGGVVYLRGSIRTSTGVFATSNTVVATLPAPARPSTYKRVPVATYASPTARGAVAGIEPDGRLLIGGIGESSDTVYLDAVHYLRD